MDSAHAASETLLSALEFDTSVEAAIFLCIRCMSDGRHAIGRDRDESLFRARAREVAYAYLDKVLKDKLYSFTSEDGKCVVSSTKTS